MNRKMLLVIISLLLLASIASAMSFSTEEALEKAAKDGQFLLLAFYDKEEQSFNEMSSVIEKFSTTQSDNTSYYFADYNDPVNQEIAKKYGIRRAADLPILIIIASNGAITGGFPKTVTTEQIREGISVPDIMLQILKPLQEQKIVLVALQNEMTEFNAESLQGVNEFADDKQYSQITAVVKADPSAAGNQDFIKQCKLITPVMEATVVVLLPPGSIGKILTGKVTKSELVSVLQACSSGGCGTGGCSDLRFKNNVSPIESPLAKVSKLNGVSFTWNREEFPQRFFPEGRQIGLIAQDVESVVPEVVNTDLDGYKSVEYDKLAALLIEAVKEMEHQIQQQDIIIQEQEKRLNKLEGKK
ncbi:MAG: tail fiber domain-containing protein [Candidatus Cloacimonetes bacterium]|nr:tail fiber domain-containing protein [Candidatus Cloacimonadota bacterium]